MRIRFVCRCGIENTNWQDWIAHWKYGSKGKWRAIVLFLLTRIEWRK